MIRKATLNDVEKICQIIGEVIVEMKEYNNDQWDESYPNRKSFEKDIEAQELYVLCDDKNSEIQGVICINSIEAKEYRDIEWENKGEALVIHRMAVNPNFRRMGIGTQLIEFAENKAKERAILSIKTDTYSLNIKMRNLFEKNSFLNRGSIKFLGKEKDFYCYEKKLK